MRLANEGDVKAQAVLQRIGALLGAGLVSFANIFSPSLFVIGGGFGVASWDHLIPAAERVLRSDALLPARDEVKVVPAELGTMAGLIGAAVVAYEALDASA